MLKQNKYFIFVPLCLCSSLTFAESTDSNVYVDSHNRPKIIGNEIISNFNGLSSLTNTSHDSERLIDPIQCKGWPSYRNSPKGPTGPTGTKETIGTTGATGVQGIQETTETIQSTGDIGGTGSTEPMRDPEIQAPTEVISNQGIQETTEMTQTTGDIGETASTEPVRDQGTQEQKETTNDQGIQEPIATTQATIGVTTSTEPARDQGTQEPTETTNDQGISESTEMTGVTEEISSTGSNEPARDQEIPALTETTNDQGIQETIDVTGAADNTFVTVYGHFQTLASTDRNTGAHLIDAGKPFLFNQHLPEESSFDDYLSTPTEGGITFNDVSDPSGHQPLTYGISEITVPITGEYLITTSGSLLSPGEFVITVNGIAQNQTQLSSDLINQVTTGTTILSLNAEDVLSLITTTGVDLQATEASGPVTALFIIELINPTP